MADLNRREFIVLSTTTVCACAAGGLMCSSAQAADAKPNTPQTPVDIGAAKDLKDGILDTWAKSHQFMVVVGSGKVYACSSSCTHKGGQLKYVENQYRCPNHGARFNIDGSVAKGPARTALDHLGITLNDQGHVIVDPAKKFPQANWDAPAASVKLPG